MTRLGVVLGVAEYSGSPANLPACDNDAAAMMAILNHAGRFDDIINIVGLSDTTSSNVKNRLSEFADKHRASPIEEIVFYFTGHGDFDGSDFSYILSDFDAKRRNKTSLSNAELDGIFRSLNPNLFVKIVDACQSGISYIKNEGILEDYLKSSSTNKFNNLYFMFSSQSSESSFASNGISDFTKSFLTAVSEASPGPVRYRDVMSAVSDDFEVPGTQTPLFVIQATNTEIFCEASGDLSAKLQGFLSSNMLRQIDYGKALTLKERVLKAEEMFCTREDAVIILEGIKEFVETAPFADQLDGLYSNLVSAVDSPPTNCLSIGKWINENSAEELFASATKESETYMAPDAPLFSTLSSIQRIIGKQYPEKNEEVKLIPKVRQVIKGYKVTTSGLPFVYLSVRLNPQLKAVDPVECHIVPILSRTKLYLFHRYRRFIYTDWDTTDQSTSTSWARGEVALKADADRRALLEKIWNGFCDFTLSHLIEKFPETDGGGTPEIIQNSPIKTSVKQKPA